ncbi:2-hydroxyacyl-CoA dehydratase family protein [Sphingosinicella sp. CPCC 101087]|uniref:2-hydroxyacyl-CoA dehydratase family protein n=1 Tax=Sphingosinicella sp. CPCC 101087 TaxID=2497754 RepID=UPI0013EB5853|nr:2-hydroxyacyl-CoA dehydratase family protein [Sphingosinicella sp. CPCC 101087]
MTALAKIDSILADPLGHARAAPAAIGYFGLELPEDLLAAFGTAAHLPWVPDRPTPRADAWLEPSFPGSARSVLEDWADGRFDFLERVLFTRGDDVSQRLYYYVCELQRRGEIGGPTPLIFDLAKIGRPTSLEHSVAATRRLCDSLGVDAARLEQGIETANLRRRALARLDSDRRAGGSLYERIGRASLFSPEVFSVVPDDLPAQTFRGQMLLAGSAPPDDRLHVAVERQGWTVAAELHERALDRLGPELVVGGDPVLAVAGRAHASPLGARSFVDRAQWLLDKARRCRADAVILWLASEEEALVWHVPRQRRLLEEAGIPVLVLADRRWDASDGAAEEIAEFIGRMAR